MTDAIRVLIVDDHPVVRDGLRGMLTGDDIEVIGEAGDGDAAVLEALRLEPDVVLMDLRMPGSDGVTATGQLSQRLPSARVLVLTTYDTDADIRRALDAGADGYLLKDAPRDELLRAIRTVAAGRVALAASVAGRVVEHLRGDGDVLSSRELDVLRLVAGGRTNRAIARALDISEATVKTHLVHIFRKLGVADRTAAVTTALERGDITLA
ncbi:MAG: response regulator transcription factor [Nitriliruptorales bacterium]|nr:response regulator transcription factor [Nitriliruptorales bacterium]